MSKSIITEDPSTREANVLASFAINAPLQNQDIIDNLAANMPQRKVANISRN